MEWSDVLQPDLDPQEVLSDRLKSMHSDRQQKVRRMLKAAVILCLKLEDQVHTIKVGPESHHYEAREMIDFPQITVRSDLGRWRRGIEMVGPLIERAEARLDDAGHPYEITASLLSEFEKFDGVVEIEVVDLPDGGPPMGMEVVLNDYEPVGGCRRTRLVVSWQVVEGLVEGRLEPATAAREITIGGDRGLAFELGGFASRQFDL